MFGKKKEEEEAAVETPQDETTEAAQDNTDEGPLKPFSRKGPAPAMPAAPYRAEIARRQTEIPGRGAEKPKSVVDTEDPKRLVVGRDIRLKGEITACERLVIEGEVEVTVSGAKLIEVLPSGLFKGDVDVERAEISGRFEGNLTAREELTIHEGGKVIGSVQYGKIVIESGGEVSGDMMSLGSDKKSYP
ncbi:polymer-forming cytoskeletal protein [Magnetospira sp. QH-2]|uniref:bactofilin family protein n=1 Tax=Magnetospira sp. (strain QH-2) TaxID=1288970 RepID=UPI00069684F4|nr:polymer-forming cytoskeletal protein [Magnetospira sp. QH-2]